MIVSLFFFTWWHASPPLRFKYKTPSSKYRRLLAFPALYTCFPTCWQTPDLLSQPWKEENLYCKQHTGKQGWCSGKRALPSHQCGPVPIPARCHMWVEFVVGSRLVRRVFLRVLRFSSLRKNRNISKFQFDQDREPTWKPAKADMASSRNIVIYLLYYLNKPYPGFGNHFAG